MMMMLMMMVVTAVVMDNQRKPMLQYSPAMSSGRFILLVIQAIGLWSIALSQIYSDFDFQGSPKSSRDELHQESRFTVAVYSKIKTDLFASCVKTTQNAQVRFAFLEFPTSGVQFSRYVPSIDQLDKYNPAWTPVYTENITSFLQCAEYANKQGAMMFWYDDICRVSGVRLSTKYPECSRTCRNYPVFVRTSCQTPVVGNLSLTPTLTQVTVTWTVADKCNLTNGFLVSWNSGLSAQVASTQLTYVITNLTACTTVNISVSPLDSIGQIYDNTTSGITTTLPVAPVVGNLSLTPARTQVTVTWTVADKCNLTNGFLVSWNSGLSAQVASTQLTYVITNFTACTTVNISVSPLDSIGEIYDNTSGITTTLAVDPSINNLTLSPILNGFKASWQLSDPCNNAIDILITWGNSTDTVNTSTSFYLITGLTACTSVTVSVSAVGSDGAAIGTSASATGITYVPAPDRSFVPCDPQRQNVTQVNVALYASVRASSCFFLYGTSFQLSPSFAVDGGATPATVLFHSKSEPLPFLVVDLGREYYISKIRILYRTDAWYSDRFLNVSIRTGSTYVKGPDFSNYTEIVLIRGPPTNPVTWFEHNLTTPLSGRYVTAERTATTGTYYLEIKQLEVYTPILT